MPNRSTLLRILTATLLIGAGVFLRFHPYELPGRESTRSKPVRWLLAAVSEHPTARRVYFDEILYRGYVQKLELTGLLDYGKLTRLYLEEQRRPERQVELPPTRFLYIFSGWLWKRAEFGAAPGLVLREPNFFERDPYLLSLRHVSALFSTALMLLSGGAAWRWAGRGAGLGVLALMAFAPLQIHFSQHAMIDGYFAFWAALSLWALWENLQQPNHRGWLALLGGALVCLVLTKENAFFVYVALLALTVASGRLRFGRVTPALFAVGLAAPALALVILINLAGGPAEFFEAYRLLVTKAQHLEYAIETGDGPWYRYLMDLLVMSPLILCLAIGGAFCVVKENRAWLYLLGFVACTYLIMCNIRYGMNLRYASIWDLPLRCLAYAQLVWLARALNCRPAIFVPLALTALCTHEFFQYRTFFVTFPIYELGPADLLQAIKILK